MVKLCHEKMLILRCILPHKKLNLLQKKVNLPPLGKSRAPRQETQLTGNNFNPLKKPEASGKISASPLQKIPIYKKNVIFNNPEKAQPS